MPKVSDAYLAARWRQILEAAAGCFAFDGFHPTSVQDIARE
jgi:AcrR family transcriptional regulator